MTERYRTSNGHPKSVISIIGGKYRLIDNIVPIIEYAAQAYGLESYYELCGGGARMLLNLPPTLFSHRVYNEMDLGFCKLFACLGNKTCFYHLQEKLKDWGFSEQVFEMAKMSRAFEYQMLDYGFRCTEMSMVAGAACAFAVFMQSDSALGQSYDKNEMRHRSYAKRVRELELFYCTLADVKVTNGDCFEWLEMTRGYSHCMCLSRSTVCAK